MLHLIYILCPMAVHFAKQPAKIQKIMHIAKYLSFFKRTVRIKYENFLYSPLSRLHRPCSIVLAPLSLLHCPCSIVLCPLSLLHLPLLRLSFRKQRWFATLSLSSGSEIHRAGPHNQPLTTDTTKAVQDGLHHFQTGFVTTAQNVRCRPIADTDFCGELFRV